VVVEFYKLACNRISSYSSLYCAVVRFLFLPSLPLLYFFPSFLGERIVFPSLLGQFAQNGVYKVLAAQAKLLMTVIWREKWAEKIEGKQPPDVFLAAFLSLVIAKWQEQVQSSVARTAQFDRSSANFAPFFVSTDNKPHCSYSMKNDVNAWKQTNNALRAREQGSNSICVTETRLRRRKNHYVVVKFEEA